MLAETVIDSGLIPVIASRWIHIGSVIVAVGGMFFLRVVLAPAAKAALSQEAHAGLAPVLFRRWARVVHIAILLMILTGIYNTIVQFPRHRGQPLYHSLWGLKVLLAVGVFFVAIAIVGKAPAFEKMRQKRLQWVTFNLVLAGAILLISNVLKNMPASL